MLRRSLDESGGHFWWPAEFVNVANPDFGNLRHLQNPGHLSLTAPSTKQKYHVKYGLCRECKKVESAVHRNHTYCILRIGLTCKTLIGDLFQMTQTLSS